MDALLFIASLVLIFFGSTLFTNGVEWIGREFDLSESVVGSVLAAVGTALPETVIPIIAIFLTGGTSGRDVGIGAILGAPFMLGTLALFITGLSVLLFRNRRETGTSLSASSQMRRHDLSFFLVAYLSAIGISFIPNNEFKAFIAPLFVIIYIVYVWRVLKTGSGSSSGSLDPLTLDAWIARLRNVTVSQSPSQWIIVVQTGLSIVFIVAGAQLFVNQIISLAELLHANATIVALIIAPIATELPEKLNSVLWVRQGKDGLALGNITGAMVFQSCIPVSFGVAFTTWILQPIPLVSALLAVIAGLWVYLLSLKNRLTASSLFFNGMLYLAFLLIALRFA